MSAEYLVGKKHGHFAGVVVLVFSKCFQAGFWAFSMFKYGTEGKGEQIYVNYFSY